MPANRSGETHTEDLAASRSVLHPIVAAAAEGNLPRWARMSEDRRAHVERVSALMAEWAEALGWSVADRARSRAAGLLHDSLKDAPPEDVRRLAGVDWPDPLLHAPAAARRMRMEGVDDEEILLAIAFHPVGHPDFRSLAEHLYLADYLEPGRVRRWEHAPRLRKMMPEQHDAVLATVVRNRLERRLESGEILFPESTAFWNRLVSR